MISIVLIFEEYDRPTQRAETDDGKRMHDGWYHEQFVEENDDVVCTYPLRAAGERDTAPTGPLLKAEPHISALAMNDQLLSERSTSVTSIKATAIVTTQGQFYHRQPCTLRGNQLPGPRMHCVGLFLLQLAGPDPASDSDFQCCRFELRVRSRANAVLHRNAQNEPRHSRNNQGDLSSSSDRLL